MPRKKKVRGKRKPRKHQEEEQQEEEKVEQIDSSEEKAVDAEEEEEEQVGQNDKKEEPETDKVPISEYIKNIPILRDVVEIIVAIHNNTVAMWEAMFPFSYCFLHYILT